MGCRSSRLFFIQSAIVYTTILAVATLAFQTDGRPVFLIVLYTWIPDQMYVEPRHGAILSESPGPMCIDQANQLVMQNYLARVALIELVIFYRSFVPYCIETCGKHMQSAGRNTVHFD